MTDRFYEFISRAQFYLDEMPELARDNDVTELAHHAGHVRTEMDRLYKLALPLAVTDGWMPKGSKPEVGVTVQFQVSGKQSVRIGSRQANGDWFDKLNARTYLDFQVIRWTPLAVPPEED